jgi:hypothetical protein
MIAHLNALIADNLTQQGSGDTITGAELRAVTELISDTLSKSQAFNAAIKLDAFITKYASHNVAAPIVFTINNTNKFIGGGCLVELVADGVNVPDISAFKKSSNSSNFFNTVGVTNYLFFFFDGITHWCNMWQDAAIVTPPVLISATISNGSANQITLVFDKPLDALSVPATVDLSVPGKTITVVAIVGSNVVVQVDTDFEFYDFEPTISYVGGNNKIKDSFGNNAADFTNVAIDNNLTGILEISATDNPNHNYSLGVFTHAQGNQWLSGRLVQYPHIRAGRSFRLLYRPQHHGGVIGLDATDTLAAVNGFLTQDSCVYTVDSNGSIAERSNGSEFQIQPFTLGNYCCIHRDGSTGVISIQTSADKITWTTIRTSLVNNTGRLYLGISVYGQATYQMDFPELELL